MKKIINFLLTSSLVLAIAGCSNAIAGLSPAEVEGKNVTSELSADAQSGLYTTEFEVYSSAMYDKTGTSIAYFDNTSDEATEYKLVFTHFVDENTVKNAISVKPVMSADNSWEIYKTGAAIDYKYEVREETVTLYIPLKDVEGVEVYIDPAILKAMNGQKLDKDNDFVQGEVDDDYYSEYLWASSTASTSFIGYERNYYASYSLCSKYSYGFGFADVLDTTYTKWTLNSVYVTGTEVKTLLDNHIKIKAYDEVSKKWTPIAVTSTELNDDSYPYTYTVIFPEFTKNTLVHVYAEDCQNIVYVDTEFNEKYIFTRDATEKTYTFGNTPTLITITDDSVASDSDFFSVTPDYNSDRNQLLGFTFDLNTSNTSGAGDVAGVADYSKIHVLDSKFNEINLGKIEQIVKATDTYGITGEEKTRNTKVYLKLEKPVALSNYYYIYADEDLTIQFQDNDGAEYEAVKSYKIGTSSYVESLNSYTKGRNLLGYIAGNRNLDKEIYVSYRYSNDDPFAEYVYELSLLPGETVEIKNANGSYNSDSISNNPKAGCAGFSVYVDGNSKVSKKYSSYWYTPYSYTNITSDIQTVRVEYGNCNTYSSDGYGRLWVTVQ